jgi:hypothetical protein
VKSLLVVVLAVSTFAGVGIAAFRSLGLNTKTRLEAVNSALTGGAPVQGKASAQETAAWIERYRAGATDARCREGQKGWDYVCAFRDGTGRRLKVGVTVDTRQPLRMSPLVGLRRPVPSSSGAQ